MSAIFEIAIDNSVVECGGVVHGTVTWSVDQPPRSVRVRAAFSTSGDGGRSDTGGGDPVTFDGAAGTGVFAVVVPAEGPMSYAGEQVAVAWVIEARADLKRERDPIETAEITVLPQGGLGLWARNAAPPPGAFEE